MKGSTLERSDKLPRVESRGKLLVVDDEEEVGQFCVEALSSWGYEAEALPSPKKALIRLQERPFDLVLVDLLMPEMDGLNFLENVKALNRDTDAIVITGYPSLPNVIKAMRIGVRDFLTKPFHLEDLETAVERCLKQRNLERDRNLTDKDTVLLAELGSSLAGCLTFKCFLDKAMDAVLNAFNPQTACLMLSDEREDSLVLAAQIGLPDSVDAGQRIPLDGSIISHVANHNVPFVLLDNLKGSLFTGFPQDMSVASVMAVPLFYSGKVLGVLAVTRGPEQPRFTNRQVHLFDLVANHLSVALDNILRYEQVNARVAELELLEQMGKEFSRLTDDEEVVRMGLNILGNLVAADVRIAGIFRREKAEAKVYLSSYYPLSPSSLADMSRELRKALMQIDPAFCERSNLILEAEAKWEGEPPPGDAPPIKSFIAVPVHNHEEAIGFVGAAGLSPKAFQEDSNRALSTLASSLSVALQNAQTYSNLRGLQVQIIKALVAAVEAKDLYTSGHSQRDAMYAAALARRLGLPPERLETLHLAALLHDVGKIGIPDTVLNKPGPLSGDEWTKIKEHPGIGADIVNKIETLKEVADIVLAHQERYDGKGYPRGLSGDEIPLEARILAVVDGFEAMTSDRAYHEAMPTEEALAILQEGANKQWDGEIVKAWIELVRQSGKLGLAWTT